jgi:hypothetical protein
MDKIAGLKKVVKKETGGLGYYQQHPTSSEWIFEHLLSQ